MGAILPTPTGRLVSFFVLKSLAYFQGINGAALFASFTDSTRVLIAFFLALMTIPSFSLEITALVSFVKRTKYQRENKTGLKYAK